MSRFGGFRQSADDLAYGEPPAPQRWDRDRFDRFGRGPPPPPSMPPMPEPPRRFEEDFRFTEREGPRGGRSVAVADHIERGPPARGYDERERDRILQDTYGEPRGGRRRTDRELFGEVDPRELADMALTPYRRKSITRDIDVDRNAAPPRPGLMRRQSSLDTFDRRPLPRYERDEYRMPPYQPVPLPIRREPPPHEHVYEDFRYPPYEPENYREVEIKRERSVHRRGGGAKSHKSKSSKAPSTVRSASTSSSSSSSFQEIEKSPSPERKIGRKGKTRMPKRLVHRDAIHDLAYPYDEEDDFFVLKIALDKEQIDEVIKISEMYKTGDKKTVYRFDEHIHEEPGPLPEELPHEEVIRKEYINPPSNYVPSSAGRSHHSHHSHHSRHPSHRSRASSPSSASTVTRRLSPARTERTHRTRGRSTSAFEERKTVVEERAPSIYPPQPPQGDFFEDRRTVYEERAPSGALIVQEREPRSQRDIEHEIRALEAERRSLRLERERPEEEFQMVEYREPRRELVVEREKSPARNVLRVEKDRKGRMALVRSAH